MIRLPVIPRGGHDADALLRKKVTREARTWSWQNQAKTRLAHVNEDRIRSGKLVRRHVNRNDTLTRFSYFLFGREINRLADCLVTQQNLCD